MITLKKKDPQHANLQQLKTWVTHQHFAQAEHWLQQQQQKLDNEDICVGYFIHYAIFLSERDYHSHAMEILQEALKSFNDNLALLTQLSELSLVQGQVLAAVMFLKQALKNNQNNSGLWGKLSSACLDYLPEEAYSAAVKSCELSKDLIEDDQHSKLLIALIQSQAKNALAMVESHAQNYATAETLFTEILAIFPNFVPALQGLGQQKMQQGAIEAALKLFEQVKKIDLVNGHLSLIRARCFPDSDEVLEKLEHAAKRPSLEGSIKTGILFQLIAAWEQRQNYAKAFTFAREANNASQPFLSYDPKAHRQQSAHIRSSFCKALYEHRQNYGIDSTIPVYIVGMPRSGTTLVEQILSGHRQIFGAGELNIIPNIIQGLERWERHVGSGRCYPDCVDDLSQSVSKQLATNILHELQAYAPEACHIVDKLPHNFENIGLIKFLFPQAKIISVRRDPRDIALSNYFTDYQAKHGGMGFAYDLTHIGEQLADHNLMMEHWHQVFPHQILEIHYESIIDNVEASAREL
ncbi:MAG: sulfotransferase, partial [Methylococcales bacterium]|nr:sulfotransferase [Methylococcales bacterium]